MKWAMLLVGAFAAALTVATLTMGRAAPAAGERGLTLDAGFASRLSSCHLDRRTSPMRPIVKVYRDAVGDETDRGADITGIRVSDLAGVVTFRIDADQRRDLLVIAFDTDCDGLDNYVLSVSSSGAVELFQLNKEYEMLAMPASIWRHGHTYTFWFSSRTFGRTGAFRFEAHADGGSLGEVSDWAPDSAEDDGASWYYDLLSR
jgi:hypothetical protein